MKAVVYRRYGFPNILQLEDIDKPAPDDIEVLIKVHTTSVVSLIVCNHAEPGHKKGKIIVTVAGGSCFGDVDAT